MTKLRKIIRRKIAIGLTLVMAISFAVPALANDEPLPQPVVRQMSGHAQRAINGMNAFSRTLAIVPVDGAIGYDVYAFNSMEAALSDVDGENAVAIARNVTTEVITTESLNYGGFQFANSDLMQAAHDAAGFAAGQLRVYIRNLTFENVNGSNVIHAPAVVNNPNFVRGLWMEGGINPATGIELPAGNLKAGAYWFRVRAIAGEGGEDSPLSEVPSNINAAGENARHYFPLSIALGPSDARELMEAFIARYGADALNGNNTYYGSADENPAAQMYLIDLRPDRPDFEFRTEGFLRFFTRMQDGHEIDIDTAMVGAVAPTEGVFDITLPGSPAAPVAYYLPHLEATVLVL